MEFVFVVPRRELFPQCYPHGLVPFGPELQEKAFQGRVERHGFFVERDHAEVTPELKQVIPYTLVVRREVDTDGSELDPQVLCLTRTKRGGEARLHDKLSIGVGGHIEPVDMPAPEAPDANRRNPIPNATRREVLEEELRVEGDWQLHAIGLLNDDSNPVGAVHVGLVQSLEVEGAVEVREADQLTGRFVKLSELEGMLTSGANFETWSSLLIPHLRELLGAGERRTRTHPTQTAS